MADQIDLEKMFGAPGGAKPTTGAQPEKPSEPQSLESIFGDPTKGGKPPTKEAEAERAYEEKVQGLLPRAREEVKGGLTGGYATAFARGVGDIPFIGPAGEAASRAVLAGLGKGEGKTFGERYEQLRAEDEALRRAYSEGTGHKIAGLAGQVIGAIATLPTGLGAAAGASAAARGAGTVGQTAAKIAGYGAEGAGYGAATAAGEKLFGTQPESEKTGIGQAAVLGGGLGAGLGAAGLGLGAAYRAVAPDWVKTFGRTDNAQWNRLGQAAQKDMAAGDVRMAPADVMEALNRGQPVAVMDMYGQNFRNEAAKALKKNPEILQDWQTHTMQRLQSQNERFEDFITRMRGTAENPAELNQRAVELAKRQSDQRYAQVLQPGVGSGSWDRSWDFWLKSPSFRKAVVETENEIRDAMALQGRDPANFMSPFRAVERVDPKTGLKFTPNVAGTNMPEWAVAFRNRVDISYLDKLQRNLNNVIEGRFGAEFTPKGDSAKGLSGARRQILDALTDPKGKFYNPLYAETRAKYSDFSDQKTAFQFGTDLLKKVNNARDAASLASKAKYMSPEERELAQHGLLADILARAQSRSQPGQINAAKLESYLKTPYIRDAMESILMPKNMENLQRYVHTENMISQVAKDVARMRAEPGAGQEVRALLWGIFSAPAAAARWLGLWSNQKMGERYAQRMWEKISSQDPNDFRDVMQMIAKNPSLRRSLGEFALSTAGKVPMATGVAAGNLPQFANGGPVRKSDRRNQHIHSATEGLLAHAMQGMADGGAIDEAAQGLSEMGGAEPQEKPEEVPYHQTPEFQNWFSGSVAHEDGVPITYYHGTSKDKDFNSFNVGRHGLWLTRDPNEASQYAVENDSQNFKYEDGEYKKTNTASRVMPVHVKAENPFTGSMPDWALKENYKKAQSDWFDTLRSQGYDSWIPAEQGGNLAVALRHPTQVKSIYNRTFDPSNKRMDKEYGGSVQGYDDGGAIDEASKGLMQEAGDQKTGHPLTNDVYHGTQGDFSEFRDDPQQHSLSRGLGIHVAKDPAVSSADYFTARGGDPRYGGRPGGNVMPMKTVPDEKFYPIHQPFEPDMGDYYHDDWAIRNEVMAHVYQNNPDLFVKDMMQQRKISKEEALDAHEKLSNGERWHDPSGGSAINFRGLVKNYALQPYSAEDREAAIHQFRNDLRAQGYEGVKYINTSTEETKNAKDKTAYIVFPDEKQPGEWFPLRSRFAKFNPEDSHKADITKAEGGDVQGYDNGGPVYDLMGNVAQPGEAKPPVYATSVKTVEPKRRVGMPTEEQIRDARWYGADYGTPTEAFNRPGQAKSQVIESPGAGADYATVAQYGKWGRVRPKEVNQEMADEYMRSQLAVGNSAISALGYDPRVMVTTPPSKAKELMTGSGLTDVGAQPYNIWTSGVRKTTPVHEAFHRGIQLVQDRESNPKLYEPSGLLTKKDFDFLAKPSVNEMVTRALMERNLGKGVEWYDKDGDYGNQQIEYARKAMRDPKFMDFLDRLEQAAAFHMAQKRPGGPRANGGTVRPKRATGGRIPEVDKMFKAAKRAMDGETKRVLHTPDDIVVQALRIAKTAPVLKG